MGFAVNASSCSDLQEKGSSWALSHTCDGSDNLLIIFIVAHDATLGARDVSTVEFNSVTCDQALQYDDGGDFNAEIWYKTDPYTAGAANIDVTFGGQVDDLVIWAISVSGADTGDPVDNTGTNNGATGDPTITVSCAANALLASAMLIQENLATLTPDQNGVTVTPCIDMGNDHGGAEYTIDSGAGGNNTNSWTYTEDDQSWIMAAVSFNAAVGFPPVPDRLRRVARNTLLRM